MYQGQKVIVVLPAYRAALTLKQTYQEIPFDLVDEVVLVLSLIHISEPTRPY